MCQRYCWDNANGGFTDLPNEFCLVCPTGEFLDLNTYLCDASCPVTAPFEIQVDLPYGTADAVETYSFCRGFDIYVDTGSLMPIELGTKEYPYKEIEDAFLEVFSALDTATVALNIYLKSGSDNALYAKTNLGVVIINLP